MKTSCIQHPDQEPLILIRKWQMAFCKGNACAAALLSNFEYWHNIRLEMSEKARHANEVAMQRGDEPSQDASLMQYHTEAELSEQVMIYGKNSVRDGIKLLAELGAITVHRNPNPRYAFDNTKHFIFQAATVSAWLEKYKSEAQDQHPDPLKVTSSSSKNGRRSSEMERPSSESNGTITETTTEITLKTIPKTGVSRVSELSETASLRSASTAAAAKTVQMDSSVSTMEPRVWMDGEAKRLACFIKRQFTLDVAKNAPNKLYDQIIQAHPDFVWNTYNTNRLEVLLCRKDWKKSIQSMDDFSYRWQSNGETSLYGQIMRIANNDAEPEPEYELTMAEDDDVVSVGEGFDMSDENAEGLV